MLAKIINNTLIKDYKVLITQNCPAKFPIVFCRYMRLMETKIYKQNTVIQQIAAGINTCPKYFKKQNNYAIINKDASILNIVFLLYYTFKANNATGFNKRLQVIDLSKNQQLLRLAGVLDSDKNLYFITDPNITKYAEFRQYLH